MQRKLGMNLKYGKDFIDQSAFVHRSKFLHAVTSMNFTSKKQKAFVTAKRFTVI